MINLRKAAIGTAVAVAFAFPVASYATPSIFFDNTGGGGGVLTNQFSWDNGNVLLQNVAPAIALQAGDMWGQTTMGTAQGGVGRKFTYQFDIPLTSTFLPGNVNGQFSQLALDNDLTRTGFFRIFVDTDLGTGAPDTNAGTGYGDVANAGLKLILAGVARLDQVFNLQQTQASSGITSKISSLGTEPGGIGKTVSSTQMQGTAGLDIDVTSGTCVGLTDTSCVDTGYFIGDISSFTLTIGIATTADATIPTFGLNAPFGPGNPASSSIVGQTGVFGDPQAHTQTTLPSNTGSVPVSVTQPINDFVCNVHTVVPIIPPIITDAPGTGPCDVQAASAGNMFVNHENAAPEPASIALLGLGLGALGFSMRRRRKQSA